MRLLLLLLLLPLTLATVPVIHPMPPEQLEQCHTERLFLVRQHYSSLLPYDPADHIIPGFWVGSVCAARNESFLRDNHIKLALSVAHEWQYMGVSPSNETAYAPIPGLRDDPSVENWDMSERQLLLATDFLLRHRVQTEHEGAVLVYCNMGISRSVTVAAVMLMLVPEYAQFVPRGIDPVDYIKNRRPVARPNTLYAAVLQNMYNDFRRMQQEYL